ncbi:MAG: LysM peptidoglycan-binding domain-containing protein [Candidatus Limnocylindrales bacterium]
MNEPPRAELEAPVCPFVAFEDDRQRHSPEPDQRHRCYAEKPPAPRSVSFQQTYCLSADFADCPTFQEWARGQAARQVRAELAAVERRDAGHDDPGSGDAASGERPARPGAAAGRRPYDWAAPPPWLADRRPPPDPDQLTAVGAEDASSAADEAEVPAPPIIPVGPAGGRANPLGRGPSPAGGRAAPVGDPELAALVRRDAPRAVPPETEEGELPGFLAGRSRPTGPRPTRRPPVHAPAARSVSQAHPAGLSLRRTARPEPEVPPWETPRHFEAYPTIRSRRRRLSPQIILLTVMAATAAIIVFVLLLSWINTPSTTPTGSGSPSPSSSVPGETGLPTASLGPSGQPGPTFQTYTVQPSDTINKIAGKFGLLVADLLAANPQIQDPNAIQVGDVINIPPPATPQPLPGESTSASP